MNVGIDARMFGPKIGGGGLGRYVEELVKELVQQGSQHRFVLFVKNEKQEKEIGQWMMEKGSEVGSWKMEVHITNIHWYTLKEQLLMGRLIDKTALDLVHFPHWNVPLFLRTPFVVTIHDLILLEEPYSARATTRHPFFYLLKRAGYKIVLKNALKRAKAIIAVSQYTKQSILKYFPHIPADKIQVIYEGLTNLNAHTSHSPPEPARMTLSGWRPNNESWSLGRAGLTSRPNDRTMTHGRSVGRASLPHSPYFLFIGNAYPHKNLETLLQAFALFHEEFPAINLVLSGRQDVFYERLMHQVNNSPQKDAVRFILNPTDETLRELYQQANAFIFPSRVEGFGLPPLEAMSFGVPTAASHTSSIPEILGDAALYFDPNSVQDMAHAMKKIHTDTLLRASLVQKGFEQIKKYSWHSTAKETLDLYETCFS